MMTMSLQGDQRSTVMTLPVGRTNGRNGGANDLDPKTNTTTTLLPVPPLLADSGTRQRQGHQDGYRSLEKHG